MSIKVGDIVYIARPLGSIEAVLITNIKVSATKGNSSLNGTVSFRLAKPDETTVTEVGVFLFFTWMMNIDMGDL